MSNCYIFLLAAISDIPVIQIVLWILIGSGILVILTIIIKQLSSPKKMLGMQKAFKNGKYNQAIKIGKEILEKDGSNIEVNYLLAESYYNLGRYNEALAEYQKTEKREVQSRIIKYTNLHEKLAELYEKKKDYEEASKELIGLKNKFPQNFDYCHQLGVLSEKRGKFELAAKFYLEAIKLKTNHVPSLISLGVIFASAQRYNDAENYLTQAKKYEPSNGKALYYLGIVKKNQNETNEALKLFEFASRDKDYKAQALFERGRIFLIKAKYEEAIIELERALRNIEDKSENLNKILNIRYMLGGCYEETKNITKAMEHYKAIYDKSPRFKDVGEKLRTYEDITLGDEMKDFLTATDEDFVLICKNLIKRLGKAVTEVLPLGKDAIQFVANESESRWMTAQKRTEILRIYRTSKPVTEKEVADTIDNAKRHNAYKSTIMSTSSFTPQAENYAQERPIVLISKSELAEMICGKH